MQSSFDTRASILRTNIEDARDDHVKTSWQKNKESTISDLREQYGSWDFDFKLHNFLELWPLQPSIFTYHNIFITQLRNAFIIWSYYPALTAACALWERILNRLILDLRDSYKSTDYYKEIYRKKSFDDWLKVIWILESWDVLLPITVTSFKKLYTKRCESIHFNPEVDLDPRNRALEAIHLIQDIVITQFGVFWQPWFFCVPGEFYIRKSFEDHPFVKNVILPHTFLVWPRHTITQLMPKLSFSDEDYDDNQLSDDEFIDMRISYTS